MTEEQLERYLHDHIPLTKAMQVSVLSVQPEGVTLGAPLQPNINHRDTVFGGSATALAITAAWSLVQTRLMAAETKGHLVIQRHSMDYELPIAGAFIARAFIAAAEDWSLFLRMLARKGRARIAVSALLEYHEQIAGRFQGEFVVLSITTAHRLGVVSAALLPDA